MDQKPLSPLATTLVRSIEKEQTPNNEKKIRVNPVVAKFASWYEKLRRAMEYREDEVILRATIERILKRKLLLGGNAKTTAEPLVRELIWARYLNDEEVPESTIGLVEDSIDLYLQLRLKVLQHHRFSDKVMNEWTYEFMSSELAHILIPNSEKETIANFMFHVIKNQVSITDDAEETKNAQVFIAVRKAFARDDIAFLRYHLFQQYFGQLTKDTLDDITKDFLKGYKEINAQLNHPLKEKIYSYIKKRTAAFLILEDLFKAKRGSLGKFLSDQTQLEQEVFHLCDRRYKSISSKVRTAIIRSVIFILFTKVIFAFLVEGTYERLVYGQILWLSILLNTSIPPLLMIIVSFFIHTPDAQNSKKVYAYITRLLFDEKPALGENLVLTKKPDRNKPFLITVFQILSLIGFTISFGAIIYVLTRLGFNPVSQFIFIFFVTIVSFVSYRISLIAGTYRIGDRQGFLTPIIDIFFMPVVRVGRRFTEGISQINIFLFLFDFIIELPFKLLFAFFEQWFLFMRSKSEELE